MTDVWVTGDGVNWQQVAAEAPWPGRHCGAWVVFRGKLWLLGGCTGGAAEDHFNDVWTMERMTKSE